MFNIMPVIGAVGAIVIIAVYLIVKGAEKKPSTAVSTRKSSITLWRRSGARTRRSERICRLSGQRLSRSTK